MAENIKKVVTEGLKEFFQTQLKPRFDQIHQRVGQLDQRFNLIEFKLTEHDQKFVAILEKQTGHDERFRDILGHFDQLYQRISGLEDEYQAIV